MSDEGSTGKSAVLSAKFTSSGKWTCAPFPQLRMTATLLAPFLFLTLAGPASARQETGPTASASISISISVAPSFGLRTKPGSIHSLQDGAPDDPGFCIATNGQYPALPVRLVRAKIEGNGFQPHGKGEPLPRCGASSDRPTAYQPANPLAVGLILISPE